MSINVCMPRWGLTMKKTKDIMPGGDRCWGNPFFRKRKGFPSPPPKENCRISLRDILWQLIRQLLNPLAPHCGERIGVRGGCHLLLGGKKQSQSFSKHWNQLNPQSQFSWLSCRFAAPTNELSEPPGRDECCI